MSEAIQHTCILIFKDGTYGQQFNKSSFGDVKVIDSGCKVLDHATVFTPRMQKSKTFKEAIKQGFTIIHAYEARKVVIGIDANKVEVTKE